MAKELSVTTSGLTLKLCIEPPDILKTTLHPESYTHNEVVKGHVKLTVSREVAVQDIQVKLSAYANVEIELGTSGTFETKKHQLMYDVLTVFPPHNVASVSKNRKFTLIPGSYDYQFELKIPFLCHCGDEETKMHSNLYSSPFESPSRGEHDRRNIRHIPAPLPPNFAFRVIQTEAIIKYVLKVSLHRPGWLSSTIRLKCPISLMPLGSAACTYANMEMISRHSNQCELKPSFEGQPELTQSQRLQEIVSPSKAPRLLVRMELWNKPVLLPQVNEFKLMLHTTALPGQVPPRVYVRSVEMILIKQVKLTGEEVIDVSEHEEFIYKSTETQQLNMKDLTAYKEPTGVYRSELDISYLLKDIKAESTPAFTTCNIALKHRLSTVVYLSAQSESWFSNGEPLKVVQDILIEGPSV